MRKILGLITVLLLGFVLVACGKDTFTVTFDSNGGSAVQAVTAEDGSTIDEPTAPTRAGFTFDGWFKESALTNAWDFDVDTVTSDITLYAKWTAVGPTDQQSVDATYDWLDIGNLAGLTNQSPRLILPTTYQAQGVSISWSIDKTAFIAANGVITQPTFEEGNQTVTLTATLTKGSVTRTKVFTATVLALPSVEETEPLIHETFDYANGDILGQATIWGPVSGKTGNSLFTVVDSITGTTIPEGSKALKIEALKELQIEAPIVHDYDLVVVEVDLYQTVTTGTSSIHIQSSASSPVVAFGLNGRNIYYRVDNGSMLGVQIDPNEWYTLRAEINLTNKTLEVFYYASNGQLVSVTPGPVTYAGTTAFQSLFIRSGSSTTETLQNPAYITNIIANRIEALPRPVELVGLGEVTGIEASKSIPVDGTFSVDTPIVKNIYGTQRTLVLDTDYEVDVDNPVNTQVPGTYEVTYTITNLTNTSDVKVITQEVVVYAEGEPNEITTVESTEVGYLEGLTTVTVSSIQPSGTLFYLLSENETEELTAILEGDSVEVTSNTTMIEDLVVGNNTYIHVVISLNGQSNVVSHALTLENVTEISTPAAFYAMASVETSGSYALVTDLDFTGFTWDTTNASFKGKLYGNGYTISNLTMNSTTQYGGIFSRANGATIRDLVLDNINVVTTARAGALIGRAENALVTIENVILMNATVQGADSNGVGALLGMAANHVILKNVAIIDSNVTTVGQKNVGGVVGRVDGGLLEAEDVYVNSVTVTTATAGTDIAAGGFVGYVRDSLASVVQLNRVVMVNVEVNAVMAGGLFGYVRLPGTATATNVYVEVSFTHSEPTHAGLIGRVNDTASYLDQTSIYGSFTGAVQNAQTQDLANTVIPENQAWWQTNIPSFVDNPLWVFDDNATFALVIYKESSKPMVNVTLEYNIEGYDEVIQVREGNAFGYGAPLVEGYNFVGWFTDEALTTPIVEPFVITVPVTLYGKYEALESFTVTFDSQGGSLVDPVDAFENEFILAPANPTRDGYTFEGWYKEDTFVNLFNFDTEVITADITLYAKWEEIPAVTYTVTFDVDGGSSVDAQVVGEGALATEPADPTKDGFTFEGWYKEDTFVNLFLFESDTITADTILYAKWAEIVPTEITTAEAFYQMTISGSDGIFLLMNDIDFTGYTWVSESAPAAFKGTFDGQGFTVSNIEISIPAPVTDQFGGIFSRLDGATVRNLVIDNISVTTGGRGGALVGRIMGNGALIENILVKNSNISGNDSNGVGGLIGLVSATAEVYHVAVIDSTISNANKNVAAFVGRVDSAPLYADDIFIANNSVESLSTASSDVGAGALIGYVRDHAASLFSGVRIVVLNTTVIGNSSGILAGYVRYPGQVDLMDAYLAGSLTGSRTGLVGYWRDFPLEYTFDQSTIFTTLAQNTPHSQTLQAANEVVTPTDLAWWNTHLEAFVLSDFWTVGNDGSIVLNIALTGDITPVETYTVTFNSNEGTAVASQTVESGDLVLLPGEPTKDGYTFDGWYKEETFVTLWDFANDVVTADVTLYAKWVADEPTPVGTPITTPQEFMTAVSGGSSDTFYVANDLDFTGVEWVQTSTGTRFLGTIDGNNKTISNITITGSGTGVYGGIFQRTGAGATIKNLTLVNPSVTVTGRAGIIAGRVEVDALTIFNVHIENGSVNATDSNGVGLLVGMSSYDITIEQVSIKNSTVTSSAKNVALFIGRADKVVNIIDVYVENSVVDSTVSTSTDQGVSVFVGYTNNAAAAINITRAIIENVELNGRSIGTLVGYYRYGTLDAKDVYLNVFYDYAGSDGLHGIIGRRNADVNTTDPVLTNVYEYSTGMQVGGDSVQLASEFMIADLSSVNQAWFDTNIQAFSTSQVWSFDAVKDVYVLD